MQVRLQLRRRVDSDVDTSRSVYACRQVELACAKQILQHARLTSASASPMFYETLRKLGADVLIKQDKVGQQLLERLYPSEVDSKWYRGFFGAQVRPSANYEHAH